MTAITFDWIVTWRSEGDWRTLENQQPVEKLHSGIEKNIRSLTSMPTFTKPFITKPSTRKSSEYEWNIFEMNKTSGSFFSKYLTT